jgi:hypothetical protein
MSEPRRLGLLDTSTVILLPRLAAAARAFARVAADLRRAGRKPTARSHDAMIAAIAIANSVPLYTVNPGDFEGITELELITVPHPDG